MPTVQGQRWHDIAKECGLQVSICYSDSGEAKVSIQGLLEDIQAAWQLFIEKYKQTITITNKQRAIKLLRAKLGDAWWALTLAEREEAIDALLRRGRNRK